MMGLIGRRIDTDRVAVNFATNEALKSSPQKQAISHKKKTCPVVHIRTTLSHYLIDIRVKERLSETNQTDLSRVSEQSFQAVYLVRMQ